MLLNDLVCYTSCPLSIHFCLQSVSNHLGCSHNVISQKHWTALVSRGRESNPCGFLTREARSELGHVNVELGDV